MIFHCRKYVFEQTDGVDNPGEVKWQLALCLLLAWIIVYFCIFKGVKSVGKVSFIIQSCFVTPFTSSSLTFLKITGQFLLKNAKKK